MSAEPTAEILRTLDQIDAETWDGLANPNGRTHPSYNPFVTYSFLKALEDTNCVGEGTGWYPHHVLLKIDDEAVGAVPLYVKMHSQGEYVFDHGWADALERAGGQYYPKLQCSVPFTPATGPRLLTAKHELKPLLAGALAQVCEQVGTSTLHATFIGTEDRDAFEEAGYLIRSDQQFHWTDDEYGDFDGFLASLASRKRKAIKRERRDALANNGIEIRWHTGAELTEELWDAFFEFYMDTGSRKWGQPYLTRSFFSAMGEQMADDTLLIFAWREGRPVAGAINFIGGDTLFGRNWGCVEHHPFLHFEVCYYQAIEFALSRGLKRVEAGAQGAHKLARGYLPVETNSAHFIPHPGFRDAIERFLRQERAAVARENEMLEQMGPYRKAAPHAGEDA
ncbi:MAG: GNAT family N-acetyltransferase [Pseudomonadota bacterium]